MTEDSYYWREAGLRSVLKVFLFKRARARGRRKRRRRRRRGKHIQQIQCFKVYWGNGVSQKQDMYDPLVDSGGRSCLTACSWDHCLGANSIHIKYTKYSTETGLSSDLNTCFCSKLGLSALACHHILVTPIFELLMGREGNKEVLIIAHCWRAGRGGRVYWYWYMVHTLQASHNVLKNV